MDRAEFIRGYTERSGIAEYATPEGFSVSGRHLVALPCRCEEDGCDGWAMVSAEGVRWHLYQNTDAEVSDPMRPHSAEEGLTMARTFIASLNEKETPNPKAEGQ